MGLLSILYGQSRVVIGVKEPLGTSGFLGKVAEKFSSELVRGWTATTTNGIVIDAAVSEGHLSTCEVSDNPIEGGADVTDHVQMKPAQLTVEGVISDTPLGYAVIGNIQNLARSITTLFGASSRSQDAYDAMIELQKSRQPFTVITSLKRYTNMILTELSIPRTATTGGAIHFQATMREVFIAQTKQLTKNLAHNVKNIAGKTIDKGQKVTETAPFEKGKTVLNKWLR